MDSVSEDCIASTTSVSCITGPKSEDSQGLSVSWIVVGIEDMMKSFPPRKQIRIDNLSIKDTEWSCHLWPNGFDEASKDNISFGVSCSNSVWVMLLAQPLKVECNVGKSDYGWVETVKFTHVFENEMELQFSNLFSHKYFEENKRKLVSGGRMELMIKISFDGEVAPSSQVGLMEETSEINRLRKLVENFSNLRLDESTSDFLIVCGDNKFPVHRNILKARSSFFNGLLSGDFAESSTGHIVIEDIDSDTMESLLEYIYTGRLKHLACKSIQLLKAADMYDLPLLKKSCQEELLSTMNLENVVDLFILADDHSAVELRAAAKSMILENKAVIVEQAGWDVKLGTLVIELFKDI